MGGKTIGSIHKSEPPMSSQELKLLSRRINPHEPLPSPHASPRKPPLPNIKRPAHQSPFTCEPCNKQYKTRNGLTYHMDRCKNRPPKKTIDCVCLDQLSKGALIECSQCHTWLHTACIKQQQVKKENYACPRCLPKTEDAPEKKDVQERDNMSNNIFEAETAPEDIPEAEDLLDFSSIFTDDAFQKFMDDQTSILDSEFNSIDWYNTTDIPSLLLSDNGLIDGYSTSELHSSSNMPSSPLSESDWLNLTNFDNEPNVNIL